MADPTPFPSVQRDQDVPVLSDGRVVLRPHRESDGLRKVESMNSPEARHFLPAPQPYGPVEADAHLAKVRAEWAEGNGRAWVLVDAEDPDTFLGGVNLRARVGGTAEIGYAVHPAGRGRGLAVRAVRLLQQHAVDLGVRRVLWQARSGNWASRRVAWACGFTLDGTRPDGDVDREGRPFDVWHASWVPGTPTLPAAPWHRPTELVGVGIRLRPWRPQDAAHCVPLTDPAHYMPPGAAPTPETFADWHEVRLGRMASGTGITWCIADAATDVPLGAALLFANPGPLVGPSGEVGYFLFPAGRGRGLARQAVELVVAHALAPADRGGLGLARVSAVTAPDNAPSNAVLEATGFTRWGLERSAWGLPDGTPGDGLHWERLA